MAISKVNFLIHIRLLVGYLGESASIPWWNTKVFSSSGSSYLKICFPRNHLMAGMHAMETAARSQHDSRIGVGRVYHLFRLRPESEEELHRFLLRHSCDLKVPEDFASALTQLQEMGNQRLKLSEGPIHLGEIRKGFNEPALVKMASLYAKAFEAGKQTYPYFTDEA